MRSRGKAIRVPIARIGGVWTVRTAIFVSRGLTILISPRKQKRKMTAEQVIPPIIDPRGKCWQQPHRRFIEVDDKYALMSEQTFKALKEYSTTLPSGQYAGKMWKAKIGDKWYLRWYSDSHRPECIDINNREILVL